MKVFIDTNIFLEYLLNREKNAIANKLLTFLSNKEIPIYISVGSFYTMIYIIESYLKKELGLMGTEKTNSLKVIMSKVLDFCHIAELDNQYLQQAINDPAFSDVEDSCQLQAAYKANCQVLITFNIADFKEGEGEQLLSILSPEEFLKKYSGKL